MQLTWKDAVSTIFMGAVIAVYVAFLNGTSLWLISSARGTATAVLVFGFVGGCALSSAGDLYTGDKSRSTQAFMAIDTTLGIGALVAAIVALITGSTVALAILVATTISLWFVSTLRHGMPAHGAPVSGSGMHGAVHPR